VRSVAVAPELLAALRKFADDAYPEECCGFLLSSADASDDGVVRRIVEVTPAANRSEAERSRRFVIRPDELREAERRAAARGTVVSGFYHSHPDHPAQPSQFDQEHAWPWYVYLILSSGAYDRSSPFGAFELDADRRVFHEIALTSGPVSPRVGGISAR
jgi:proteasome lid subunit RPN8/RPN11